MPVSPLSLSPAMMPSKEEIQTLPLFGGLGLSQILLPRTPTELEHARAFLLRSPHLGFDTEMRPMFSKNEPMRGPDVVQFATGEQACVLQMHIPSHVALAREVLKAPDVLKVGFDLRNDQAQLQWRLGVQAKPLLDLVAVFHAQGHRNTVGAKSAVALLLRQRLVKSKRVTTSNWGRTVLEPRQILYAANDAHVAWRVYQALGFSTGHP